MSSPKNVNLNNKTYFHFLYQRLLFENRGTNFLYFNTTFSYIINRFFFNIREFPCITRKECGVNAVTFSGVWNSEFSYFRLYTSQSYGGQSSMRFNPLRRDGFVPFTRVFVRKWTQPTHSLYDLSSPNNCLSKKQHVLSSVFIWHKKNLANVFEVLFYEAFSRIS